MHELTIEGEPTALSAAYTLRFVELPGGGAAPVLYHHGRRVIRRWTLRLEHEQERTNDVRPGRTCSIASDRPASWCSAT